MLDTNMGENLALLVVKEEKNLDLGRTSETETRAARSGAIILNRERDWTRVGGSCEKEQRIHGRNRKTQEAGFGKQRRRLKGGDCQGTEDG